MTMGDADDDGWEGDAALWTLPNRKYPVCNMDGKTKLSTRLDWNFCSKETYAEYLRELEGLHATQRRP